MILVTMGLKAQKIDSIFVNLYTDSLKKGTHNYINIDGLYSNGSYLPLDSNDIIFKSSHGIFYGNNLWIPEDLKEPKVTIHVTMRKQPALVRQFDMYIKTTEDPHDLMSNEEVIEKIKDDLKKEQKQSKKDRKNKEKD